MGEISKAGSDEIPGLVERLFAPIQGQTWAAAVAHDLGVALVALAVVEVVFAALGRPMEVLPAGLYAASGALLWLTPTRVGALLALLTAVASLATTLLGVLGPAATPGVSKMLLALVALWISGRALVATLAYRRFGRGGTTLHAGGQAALGSDTPAQPKV